MTTPPVLKIAPQDWMTHPATQRVIGALNDAGIEARFVGGCVRDALMGRPVADIDIATPALPTRVSDALGTAGIAVYPTGIDHGTVTAVADHKPFEITTLRRDVETDGRWARVAFTDSWAEDAARRDFTMNALFCAPDGSVYDYFDGLADLRAGYVRFVGVAKHRIAEDVLRLLRFFRFYAHFGRSEPDPDALAAASNMAPLLHSLSGERVREETRKLLMAANPVPVIELMRRHHVLQEYLPAAQRLEMLSSLLAVTAPADWLLRLAALLIPDGAAARQVAQSLRFSNDERERLVAMIVAPPIDSGASDDILHRQHYDLGSRTFCDQLWLSAAADRLQDRRDLNLMRVRDIYGWGRTPPPQLPIKGADLLTLGVEPGPALGALLRRVEQWWKEGGFQASRAECLAHARQELTVLGSSLGPADLGR